jgi:DNA-directed RNA polymerase subunit RPC12/RpoP
MKPGAIACPYCGGLSLRRSRRKAWFEFFGMLFGRYPFRCLDCNQRSWVSIWLFSRLKYAKCPKCLGLELTGWPRKRHRLNLWRNLLSTFGAHRYRCAKCRYNFLSFRPRHDSPSGSSEQADSLAETEIVSEANAKP